MGIENTLGKFYFRKHSNNPPDLIQVIGWTMTATKSETQRKCLYIRKIPISINHGIYGGSWSINNINFEKYKITLPIRKKTADVYDTATFISDDSLRYRGSIINKLII